MHHIHGRLTGLVHKPIQSHMPPCCLMIFPRLGIFFRVSLLCPLQQTLEAVRALQKRNRHRGIVIGPEMNLQLGNIWVA